MGPVEIYDLTSTQESVDIFDLSSTQNSLELLITQPITYADIDDICFTPTLPENISVKVNNNTHFFFNF